MQLTFLGAGHETTASGLAWVRPYFLPFRYPNPFLLRLFRPSFALLLTLPLLFI